MIQDSFFQEAFWVPIPESERSYYLPNNPQCFTLVSKKKQITLAYFEGELIKLKNAVPIKSLKLIQVTLSLDECGLRLSNKFGTLTLNGCQVQDLYMAINSKCMHADMKNFYIWQNVQFQLPNHEICCYKSLGSQRLYSVRRYGKNLSKQLILKKVMTFQHAIIEIYEDEEFIYIIHPYLNGEIIDPNEMSYIEFSFGIFKMLHHYHSNQLLLNQIDLNNILLLDDNYNMQIIDTSAITQDSNFQLDIQRVNEILQTLYPHNNTQIKKNLRASSCQDILLDGTYQSHFGEQTFYDLLQRKPHQKQCKFEMTRIEKFLYNQETQIDTINSIKQFMLDSEEEYKELRNPYHLWLKQYRKSKYSFEGSPLQSPIIQQNIQQEQPEDQEQQIEQQEQKQIKKHMSKLSSRQIVLDTLLSENLINQDQYNHYYREEEFQSQKEIEEFSFLLQKEIEAASQFTTPMQSDDNSTCPNTVKINQGKQIEALRLSDFIMEVQSDMKLQQNQLEYNPTKVLSVRKHLFQLH